MGFLLSLAYNINRYMLEHKVLTNLLARLAFILLQEKYHAYFLFILRVNLLEYVECEQKILKYQRRNGFSNYQEKWDIRYSIKGKALVNVLSRCLYMLYHKRHLYVGNKIK